MCSVRQDPRHGRKATNRICSYAGVEIRNADDHPEISQSDPLLSNNYYAAVFDACSGLDSICMNARESGGPASHAVERRSNVTESSPAEAVIRARQIVPTLSRPVTCGWPILSKTESIVGSLTQMEYSANLSSQVCYETRKPADVNGEKAART